MQRNKKFASDLTERLIDPNSYVIDVKSASESKKISKPFIFPDWHLQAYFFTFLDFEATANYAFINKATLYNVCTHATTPSMLEHRPQFLKSLREIAYCEEDKVLVDDCIKAMEGETAETCVMKTKRHLTWLFPYVAGEAALIGSFIYKCVESSGVSDAMYDAKIALHNSMFGRCDEFFEHSVWDFNNHCDFNDPSCWHMESTDLCVNDSPGWELCDQMKVMTAGCISCISDCGTYSNLDSAYNKAWWEAAGWGLGTIAAIGVGVCAGIGIVNCWRDIQDLYNPLNKPFFRFSNQTKDMIYTLNITFKITDSAETIISKLDEKKSDLHNQEKEAELPAPIFLAFSLFRKTLPEKSKLPNGEIAQRTLSRGSNNT